MHSSRPTSVFFFFFEEEWFENDVEWSVRCQVHFQKRKEEIQYVIEVRVSILKH